MSRDSTDRNVSAVDFARTVAKESVSFFDLFLSLFLSHTLCTGQSSVWIAVCMKTWTKG